MSNSNLLEPTPPDLHTARNVAAGNFLRRFGVASSKPGGLSLWVHLKKCYCYSSPRQRQSLSIQDTLCAILMSCSIIFHDFPSFLLTYSYIFLHIIHATMQWIVSAVFSHLYHSDHSEFAPHPKIKSPRRPTLFNLEVQLPALLLVKACCLQTCICERGL